MLRSFIYLLLALFLLGSEAFAAPIALQEAVDQSIAQNPEIKSYDQQVESASAKKHQALAPSTPTFSVFYNDGSSPASIGSAASRTYQFSQPIAFPGKAYSNFKALSNQEKVIVLQAAITKLQVATDVKKAYLQLSLAQKNLELHKKLRSYYEEILAIAKRRYESGSITQIDYLSAKAAIYSDMNDVQDLESSQKVARAQLNVLLGNEANKEIEVEELTYKSKPEIKISEAEKIMLDQRLEIKMSEAQLKLSEENYKLAKMTLLPDFQVVAGSTRYNFGAASPYNGVSNRLDTYNIGLQMSVPLWAPLNESQNIIASGHDRSAAQYNLRNVINQSENALQSSVTLVLNYESKIKNYESNLIPLTEQAFKLALINYSNGRVDFQALSNVAESWHNVQRDYNSAVAGYLISYSTYGQVIGEDL